MGKANRRLVYNGGALSNYAMYIPECMLRVECGSWVDEPVYSWVD